MKVSVSLIFSLLIILIQTQAYRILGIFPFEWKSHHVMFNAIVKELARRGHQIDVITHSPLKNPVANYKVVAELTSKDDILSKPWSIKFVTEFVCHTHTGYNIFPIIGNYLCEYLDHPHIQKIFKHSSTRPAYDLVIIEAFASRCFAGIAYELKAPVVYLSALSDIPWLNELLGQPVNTASYPYFLNAYFHPMSFHERLLNTVQTHLANFFYKRYTDDVQNALMKKHIDPNIPTLQELKNNVALALVNSHYSLHGVQPRVPNLIEIAGAHIVNQPTELPNELARWMNESTAGVIYFTLGSKIKIETLPEYVVKAFYSAFMKLAPLRVLMKVNNRNELLPGLPDNVKISRWIPQIGVLAHKNTKVFITHGGLMSCLESLTFAVPIVGIPIFGDQFGNIQNFEKKNMALHLDFDNLTEDLIYKALYEILNSPKYKNAAKYESARFLDRPLNALDTAIYWIEYAARNGPKVLQSPAVTMPWWRVACLDIYLFVFVLITFAILIILLILKIALNLLQKKNMNGTKVHAE